jgi:hypothetical protein
VNGAGRKRMAVVPANHCVQTISDASEAYMAYSNQRGAVWRGAVWRVVVWLL